MRIFLCDDDPLILEQLQQLICDFFTLRHLSAPAITACTSGEELLSGSQTMDMVFLDIEMPGMNGIFIGKELKRRNPNCIIFIVTSYSEYLDDAMRFHVFRYLTKPLEKQRLYRNLQDALQYYSTFSSKIAVETKEKVYSVATSQIIAIEAKERKVIVYTTKRELTALRPMQHWLATLPSNQFFQTHRSFLINFEYVTEFDHLMVHLSAPPYTAYLTRRKYTDFKNSYLLYLESTR